MKTVDSPQIADNPLPRIVALEYLHSCIARKRLIEWGGIGVSVARERGNNFAWIFSGHLGTINQNVLGDDRRI